MTSTLANVTGWMPFPELDVVLDDLRRSVRSILGASFVGMYLEGSLALGAADAQSDADFIVVTTEKPKGMVATQLRQLHDEIPTRPGVWNMNLEGSYADEVSLRDGSGLGVPWLFNDRGHRTLEWDTHCNTLHTRWILRNYGIALDGSPARSLVDEVPEQTLQAAARADISGALGRIESWADMGNAWTQKFIVQTYSRMLYTATTGRVASKPQALTWAIATLDPQWNALLLQVTEDRVLPWQLVDPPRPGSMERAAEYAQYIESRASHMSA